MKRQLFQPLMILNLEFDYRPKANLQRLEGCIHRSSLCGSSLFALQVGDVYVSGRAFGSGYQERAGESTIVFLS